MRSWVACISSVIAFLVLLTAAGVEAQAPAEPDTKIEGSPQFWIGERTADFAFGSTRPDAAFECSVDGAGYENCPARWTAGPFEEGPHELRVRAIHGGQVDPSPAVHHFWVDTTPPELTLVGGPRGLITDPTPTFDLSVNEPTAVIHCAFTWRNEIEPCGSPATIPRPTDDIDRLPEGFTQFGAVAIDAAGNVGNYVGSVVRVDTLVPDTRIVANRQTLLARRVKMNFISPGEQASFRCSLDRRPLHECTSPHLFVGLRPGDHTFRVAAYDEAGNVDATPARFRFVVARRKHLERPPRGPSLRPGPRRPSLSPGP